MKEQNLILGILAHVDAGKTTLSEALLHITGAVRNAGRVDHGNAFLDTDEMEKERGITIFSKQARFVSERGDVERSYTLLDTPGHADFSTEMERVLGVLDCAVLVISAADGVNGQVRVLWRLLDHYNVPVFVFVNKMDQDGADRGALLASIKKELSTRCVDIMPGAAGAAGGTVAAGRDAAAGGSAAGEAASPLTEQLQDPDVQEEIAVCDDDLLDLYLEGEPVGIDEIRKLTAGRKLFPVLFGAALREQGVAELLEALDLMIVPPRYGDEFHLDEADRRHAQGQDAHAGLHGRQGKSREDRADPPVFRVEVRATSGSAGGRSLRSDWPHKDPRGTGDRR